MPAPRKKKTSIEYELLAVGLRGYKASVDATVNSEARDKRLHHDDPKVYRFNASLALEGTCVYPDGRAVVK